MRKIDVDISNLLPEEIDDEVEAFLIVTGKGSESLPDEALADVFSESVDIDDISPVGLVLADSVDGAIVHLKIDTVQKSIEHIQKEIGEALEQVVDPVRALLRWEKVLLDALKKVSRSMTPYVMDMDVYIPKRDSAALFSAHLKQNPESALAWFSSFYGAAVANGAHPVRMKEVLAQLFLQALNFDVSSLFPESESEADGEGSEENSQLENVPVAEQEAVFGDVEQVPETESEEIEIASV